MLVPTNLVHVDSVVGENEHADLRTRDELSPLPPSIDLSCELCYRLGRLLPSSPPTLSGKPPTKKKRKKRSSAQALPSPPIPSSFLPSSHLIAAHDNPYLFNVPTQTNISVIIHYPLSRTFDKTLLI